MRQGNPCFPFQTFMVGRLDTYAIWGPVGCENFCCKFEIQRVVQNTLDAPHPIRNGSARFITVTLKWGKHPLEVIVQPAERILGFAGLTERLWLDRDAFIVISRVSCASLF
jgi:hypothetical protein